MICIIIETNNGEKCSVIVEPENKHKILGNILYKRIVAEYKVNSFVLDKTLQ